MRTTSGDIVRVTYYSVKEEMCQGVPRLLIQYFLRRSDCAPDSDWRVSDSGRANRKLVWLEKPTKQDLRVLWEFLIRIQEVWLDRKTAQRVGGSLARSQAQIDQ